MMIEQDVRAMWSDATAVRPVPALFARHWLAILFMVSLALGIAGRMTFGAGQPLWFDETFSAVIATQQSFAAMVHWCMSEVTGPAYYMPLWAWEKIAGPSDMALRLPGLFFSIITPLILAWRGNADRDLRLLWATLVLLWLPAMVFSLEARPYAQLFFLCAIQAIAFGRLIQRPGISSALVWATITTLAILTHYQAFVIGGVQGILYLAHHRKVAVSTWPALAPFLVLAAWLSVHLPVLLAMVGPHAQFNGTWPLSKLGELPTILFGVPLHGAIVLAVIAASLVVRLARRGVGQLTTRVTPEALVALSGVIAFGVIFGLAFIRPGFAPRYVMPAMPAVLFAIAWWARGELRRDIKYVAVALATMVLMAAGVVLSNAQGSAGDSRHLFNMERPSAWLAQQHPRRLVYFWDGAVGEASDPVRIAEVAGFFLQRAGHPVTVSIAHAPGRTDPNRAVLAMTAHDPDAAILWMSNDSPLPNRLPRLAQIDQRLECRNFGGYGAIVTACRARR